MLLRADIGGPHNHLWLNAFNCIIGVVSGENLPDPEQLMGMQVVKDVEPADAVDTSPAELTADKKKQPNNGSVATKSHFLPAPGLPTISNKLAQKIWDLEFIEMDEFLPSNKTVQAMENPASLQEGIMGALQQLQQPSKRVMDILTWIRCFSLYIAVMAAKRHDLVAPMTSHMHTVMRLQAMYGGAAWIQYDWRSRREMNAEGVESWQKRDPWQLLSCLPGTTRREDCFAINTKASGPAQMAKQQPGSGGIYLPPSKGQPLTPGGRRRRLNRVCPLFNKARAGCHYGEECIFVHRCSVCKKEDHGRYACPSQDGEREGLSHGNR